MKKPIIALYPSYTPSDNRQNVLMRYIHAVEKAGGAPFLLPLTTDEDIIETMVDMCDGMFELLLVRAPKELAEIGECIQAVQKQKYNCRMITFCKTQKAVIHTTSTLGWSLDGEKEPGHTDVEIENLHRAFRLVK